jgi:hypothetical protein
MHQLRSLDSRRIYLPVRARESYHPLGLSIHPCKYILLTHECDQIARRRHPFDEPARLAGPSLPKGCTGVRE